MQRRRAAASALLLISLSLALTPFFITRFPAWSQAEVYTEEYVLSYNLTVRYENRGNETWVLSDADMAVPLFSTNELQDVKLVWSSEPVKDVVVDQDGNMWAILEAPVAELEPGEALFFSVSYEIRSRPGEAPDISIGESGTLDQIPEELREEFCGPAACWQTDFKPLRDLAYSLSKGEENVLEIIASFVSWIHSNISYVSYEMPRYPNETFLGRKGDCDDQANLFITLCRIVGIPAYLQVGCIYLYPLLGKHEVSVGSMWSGHVEFISKDVAWHGWAVVFVPPWGWLPVDLTAAYGLEEDPLNAIRNAIYWSWVTILYREIKTTDYIREAYEARKFLLEKGIYVFQSESMALVGHEEVPRPGTALRAVRALLFYTAITVAVIGASAASLALLLARREGREEPITPAGLFMRPRTPRTSAGRA